jgi:hypothetical protein
MDYLSPSELIAVAVIFVAIGLDVLRDAQPSVGLRQALLKRLSLFTPLGYILLTVVSWEWWGAVSILCWIVWKVSLHCSGGVGWDSVWVRWVKGMVKRVLH